MLANALIDSLVLMDIKLGDQKGNHQIAQLKISPIKTAGTIVQAL
jgi:hypothetical protein